jgi:hypothetical protein
MVAAGLIAAGCGGDDGEDTTAAGTTATTAETTPATESETTAGPGGRAPLKAEFIEQGDAICAEANEELRELEQQAFGGGPPNEQELSQFTDTLADNVQGQIDGLRSITPPENDEDEIAAILDLAERGVEKLRGAAAPSQTQELVEASRMLRAYGFEECGQ